jgi:hypothetical protein
MGNGVFSCSFYPFSVQSNSYLRAIALCMPVWYGMSMKRTAMFLKSKQIERLQALSRKTGAPVAELVRRAIDAYLKEQESK